MRTLRTLFSLTRALAREKRKGHERGFELLELVIFIFVAAALLPTAFNAIFDVNTSGWGATGTLFDLLPLFAVVGIAIYFMSRNKHSNAGL